MSLDDDIRTLSGVALFQGLDRDHLRLLAFGADRIDLADGQRLYREGDIADSAFLLVEGRIALYSSRERRRLLVGSVQPGSMLSELALIADSQRLTDAVAAAPSRLLRIDRKSFRRVLEEYPDLAAVLYEKIAADLQTMIHRIERLAPQFER
jgi:CRP-like cAMP-binding protein